jgi:general secretion pathway protein M
MSMLQWFNDLKRQDQLMLSIGGAALAAYLLFVVLYGSMAESSDVLARQNTVAKETLQEVKALAARYKALEKSSKKRAGGAKKSLTRLIDDTVKKNELVMKRFQPSSSGDVQVRFENAMFNNTVAWLNQLETEHGVFIKDLSVSPGSGSGLVNVTVRLRQGI